MTPSGKIDRDALPAPGGERQSAEAYAEPQTDMQHRLTVLWQSLLAVERVGIDDNFFDLGGHSLLVVQLHSRLRETVRDAPSVIDLFKFSTIRSLADHLGRSDPEESSARAVDLLRERAGRQREAFRRRRRQAAEGGVDVE
jgi:hypothetical protein